MNEYNGIKYKVCDEVYPPAEDTFLLIDHLNINKNDSVLEIGTGTGIISITASEIANKVTSCDINPHAIECTKNNILLNNKKNINVLKSDLFENISDKYDLILFNTPYLPVTEYETNDNYSKAWNGGIDGRKVIDKFLEEISDYIKDKGKIQLVQSSLSNNEKTINYLKNKNFEVEITATHHQFFEDITLITAFKK